MPLSRILVPVYRTSSPRGAAVTGDNTLDYKPLFRFTSTRLIVLLGTHVERVEDDKAEMRIALAKQ